MKILNLTNQNLKNYRFIKSRKAFLADPIVDLWAYILFVIVIVIFTLIFKFGATNKEQILEDKKDIIYGNYYAQVFLRQPIVVGDKEFSMSELISLYDYNQSLEHDKNPDLFKIIPDPRFLLSGFNNPMQDAIVSAVDEFTEKYFSKDCYVFSIHGQYFDYSVFSSDCPLELAFSPVYFFSNYPKIPKDKYLTYVAPVDPRDNPIVIVSVYDLNRLFDLYQGMGLTNLLSVANVANVAFCATTGIAGCISTLPSDVYLNP